MTRHDTILRLRRCALVGALSAAVAALAAVVSAKPAQADFRLCNNTGSKVGIALGYKDNDGWATEGWWNLPARGCETLLRGMLAARFYYIYAVDYDRGGEWAGKAFMCTRDKEFTVRGTDDCLARGFDRTGFFEVDTGDQQTWTVQLSESGETPSSRPPGSLPGLPPGRPPVISPPATQAPSGQSPSSLAPGSLAPGSPGGSGFAR